MKRLFLTIIAAITFPSLAGDLGNADFENFKVKYGQLSEKENRVTTFENVRCGFFYKMKSV